MAIWPFRVEDIKKLSAFDHSCLRYILRVRQVEKYDRIYHRSNITCINSGPAIYGRWKKEWFLLLSTIASEHIPWKRLTLSLSEPKITREFRTRIRQTCNEACKGNENSKPLLQIFRKKSASTELALLENGLQELSLTSKFTSKIAETQQKALNTLTEWAKSSQNAAIDDVMQNTNELFRLFSEKQIRFAQDYNHFLQQLEKIVEDEREITKAEHQVNILEEKERKLRKEIQKRPSFFRRGGDIFLLRQELDKVIADKEKAKRIFGETRAEMEVIKMFRFRKGMQGIADSYCSLANKCHAVFTCHREITELVPAISEQDVQRMVYDGMHIARERVNNLRRSLNRITSTDNLRQSIRPAKRNEPSHRLHRNSFPSPPPPYSTLEQSLSSNRNNQSTENASETINDHVWGHKRYVPHASSQTSSKLHKGMHSYSFPLIQRLYPKLPKNPYLVMKKQHASGLIPKPPRM
ncbi:unnamed protein product [Dracunculus medinensis]|uniref:F-BAR domain-containing protein n=1 Tax=Dracunculus medinensis TaxID=318479 RepID=A0A0N4UPC0_DRAME|nr:unnamed protein product [Dracunculus medinensis]